MAWWNRKAKPESLTADATIVQGPGAETRNDRNDPRTQLYRTPDEWQRECWDFYDSLGEFRQGITWKANMLSRVRLRAAKIVPNADEPEIVDSGPAHDLVRELAGGIQGQAQLMSSFAVYLDVPGECWLIGETVNQDPLTGKPRNKWYTRSIEEVRPSTGPSGFSVAEGRGRWRNLPNDAMVARVYRPHKRWHNVADSPARAARPLMRELELVNRHIQAQYMSRLASAGVIAFPDEITFPVRPEFQDADDPFIAEWIEIAAQAIKTPGTAASVVPIPIRVPGEFLDKIKMIDFTLKIDGNIIEKRDSALARLAIELDMPPEALLGTRGVNHWSAWLVDEQGVKIHIAPDAEIVVGGLTEGYLWPRLKAAGETDVEQWVVWYDASELVLRPDHSASAQEAYDRLEINGKAYRREIGQAEADAPSEDELREMILKKASLQPVNTFAAMDELGLAVQHDTPPAAPRPEPGQTPDANKPTEPGAPDQPEKPLLRPEKAASEAQLLHQSKLMHAVKIDFDGSWALLHPQDCREHQVSCPVNHQTQLTLNILPGMSGLYRCWLNSTGEVVIGERILNGDAANMIFPPRRVGINGSHN